VLDRKPYTDVMEDMLPDTAPSETKESAMLDTTTTPDADHPLTPWAGLDLPAMKHMRDQLDKAIKAEEAALVEAEKAKREERIRELMAGPLDKDALAELHRLTAAATQSQSSKTKKAEDEKEERLLAYHGTDAMDPNRVLYWYDHRTAELRKVPEGGISGKFGYYPTVDAVKAHLAKRKREANAKGKGLYVPECFR
jgi:hypothetical protein